MQVLAFQKSKMLQGNKSNNATPANPWGFLNTTIIARLRFQKSLPRPRFIS
jgi:hypothetical protein